MFRLLFALPFLILISGCQESDEPLPPDFLFGHYYGMCLGEQCVELFRIQGQQLYENTEDNYPNMAQQWKGTAWKELPSTAYEQVTHLQAVIPDELFAQPNGVIGQPDAGDWGGIYIQTQGNGQLRWWYLDLNEENLPESLHKYVQTVEEAIQELNKE